MVLAPRRDRELFGGTLVRRPGRNRLAWHALRDGDGGGFKHNCRWPDWTDPRCRWCADRRRRQRANPKRLRFASIDRLILGGICRLFPKMYDALAIVRPDTVVRWHRAGFRLYWRWKSRHRCGRSAADPWRASQAWHRDW